jgi:AraC-like DNA-binding protein/quercetin dioxygenase-like cupin family protein
MRLRKVMRKRASTAKPKPGGSGPFHVDCGGSATGDPWRQQLVGDLVRGLRLRNSVFFRPEFRSPWGIAVADHGPAFHIVDRGSCWLDVEGISRPIQLYAGDFVVIPRGDPHIIRDAPTSPAVSFFDLAARKAGSKGGVLRAGGTGRITKLVCGVMQIENGATSPLLAILPPLLCVKATAKGARPWLRRTLRHIVAELDSSEGAEAEVVTRLADILFVQALRSYFEENSDSAKFGWLAAVRDQRIGPALALLHGQPHQPWTVASLARRAAMSRSAFADRFTSLVGEPPFHYLTRVRIDAAATRLRSTQDALKAIAAAVGYESVAAFTRSFRLHTGMTPAEYREARRTQGRAQ